MFIGKNRMGTTLQKERMQNNSLDTCQQKSVMLCIIRCISVKIAKNRRLSVEIERGYRYKGKGCKIIV